MSDDPNNLVLELLRGLRAAIDTMRTEVSQHMATTNRRLSSIERTLMRQRSDLTADAANSVARIAELEDQIEALASRIGTLEA